MKLNQDVARALAITFAGGTLWAAAAIVPGGLRADAGLAETELPTSLDDGLSTDAAGRPASAANPAKEKVQALALGCGFGQYSQFTCS